MMKLALMRTATGKEDPELTLINLSTASELPASEIAAQINASQSSSNRHQLFRGDFVNQAFMVELWQINHYERASIKETCLGQETRAMDIRPVEI